MAPITSAIRRQMTDEGARVTADRDEFLAVCDAVDAIHARKLKALDASTARVDELCRENERLRGLVEDMHAALQAFCDAQDVHGDNCPLWVERTDDCELRGIEQRMRELGIEEES